MYGGAVLNEEVGNTLASKGVSLQMQYGWYVLTMSRFPTYVHHLACSTEAGQMNTFARREPVSICIASTFSP